MGNPPRSGPDPRKVFVVYGRNLKIRDATFDFLRAVGLEPIEWEQAVKLTGEASPYVGRVLECALAAAQAIVVILTGDDEARLRPIYQTRADPPHEKDLTPQPRPNVLFEAGMALARSPERTILLQFGDVRPFSDIAGRHVLRFTGGPEDRNRLKNRLNAVGCLVNDAGSDWLTKGEFGAPEPFDPVPVTASGPARKARFRFVELIGRGVRLRESVESIQRGAPERWAAIQAAAQSKDEHVVLWPKFAKWASACASFLSACISSGHVHSTVPERFARLRGTLEELQWGIAILEELEEDLGNREIEGSRPEEPSGDLEYLRYTEDSIGGIEWHWMARRAGAESVAELPRVRYFPQVLRMAVCSN